MKKKTKYDLKVLLRNRNAKIGGENIFKPTLEHRKHEYTNENRRLLIDFAKEKDMIIKCTYFQKKKFIKVLKSLRMVLT